MNQKYTYQDLERQNKALLEELKKIKNNEKVKRFFENNMAIMLQVHSGTKQITDANKAAAEFYGYSKSELLQKTINNVHTLSPEKTNELMGEAIKNDSNFFEFRHKVANGKIKDVEVFASPFQEDNEIYMILTIHDITSRKKVEKDLKESESNFIALINNQEESIWSINNNYEYITFNTFFAEEYFKAYNIELEIGLSSIEILTPELQDYWITKYDTVLSGQKLNFEFSYNGELEIQTYEVRLNPIISDESIIGVAAISLNITERKKAEELRILENIKFQSTIDAVDAVIYVADMQTHELLYLNELGRKSTGDKVGRKCYTALQKGRTEPCEFCTNNLLLNKNGEPNTAHIWEFKNTITERWYQCRDKAIEWPDGRMVRLEIATDITERKKVEQLQKENTEQIAALLDAIPDMMLIQNYDGVYIDYREAKSFKSYIPPEIFLGKKMSEVLPADVTKGFEKLVEKAIKTKLVQSYEYSLPMPTGEDYFDCRIIAYGDDKILSIIRNITNKKRRADKLKESEQKLKIANATKDKFFSIIAHDLRSPFNNIIGFSGLLLDTHANLNVEEREKLINPILKSGKETLKLLDNLLNWAKTQTGKIAFTLETLALENIFINIIEQNKASATNKNIKLLYAVQEETTVFADTYMLHTILRNLMSNAIKFTQRNGEIILSAEQNENFTIISVKDSGIGISKKKQNEIFEINEKASTPGTEKERGTGLGLVLCKEFIDRHNGKIEVDSKEGFGSTFKITFPNKIAK